MAISYIPDRDEMVIKFCSIRGTRRLDRGPFKLSSDAEGNICYFSIKPFIKELEEFRKNLNILRLGGLWTGVEITNEDIKGTRSELLKTIERKW